MDVYSGICSNEDMNVYSGVCLRNLHNLLRLDAKEVGGSVGWRGGFTRGEEVPTSG